MKSVIFRITLFFLLACGLFLLNTCQSLKMNSNRDLLTNQQDSTKYYVYHIEYPDSAVASPIADSLRYFAKNQKQAFMDNLPSDTSQYNVTPYELLVRFKKTFQSAQAVSYVAYAYKYTGGAHGRSVIKTVNYDLKNRQFITLHSLFRDTTALKAISKVAKQKIMKRYYQDDSRSGLRPFEKKMLDRGTAPAIKNYQQFYFAKKSNQEAKGIEIIFSPYQVGPHSFGIPKVFIGDSVFYDHLSSQYKPLFTNP